MPSSSNENQTTTLSGPELLDLDRRTVALNGIKIWNKRNNKTPFGVKYCGRPTPYGNPFVVGRDGKQGECCDKFEQWLETGENFGVAEATEHKRKWILAHVKDLKGQDLECWCWPKRCHTETLVRLANQ